MFYITSRTQFLELIRAALETGVVPTLVVSHELSTTLPLAWLLELLAEATPFLDKIILIIQTGQHRGREFQLLEKTPHLSWVCVDTLGITSPGLYLLRG